jgi:hypothetical protein
MNRVATAVGALALLLRVVAGCSATVVGDASPAGDGRTPLGAPAPGAGGIGDGGATSTVDLCSTLSAPDLEAVGMAGARARSIGGPVASCQWTAPGQFVPVVLMLSPADDLDTFTTAVGAGSTHRETEVAGLRAIEGGTAAGDGACNLFVQHPAGVISVLAPGGCDQARRIVEHVVPDLPA